MKCWWIALCNGLLSFAVIFYFGMKGLAFSVPLLLFIPTVCWLVERWSDEQTLGERPNIQL